MSLIGNSKGASYAPGWFLAHEECERETRQIPASMGVASGGGKYVKAGTPFPSNNGQIEGFVYGDVDVTNGDAPGSVVVAGSVDASRLPVTLDSAAKTKLESSKGWRLVAAAKAATRPY